MCVRKTKFRWLLVTGADNEMSPVVTSHFTALYSCVYILQQYTQLCLHLTVVGSMAGLSPLHILGPQTCLLAEGWFPANILARRNPKRHFSSLGSLAVWRRRWLKSELGLHRTKKEEKSRSSSSQSSVCLMGARIASLALISLSWSARAAKLNFLARFLPPLPR